jgi:hypothetical protein
MLSMPLSMSVLKDEETLERVTGNITGSSEQDSSSL